MSNQIDTLTKQVAEAKEAYYNGNPVMDDATYDALEDELRKLDPSNPVLAYVGAAPTSSGWPKVKHAVPMGSLNKAQDANDMTGWWTDCGPAGDVLVMDKLDGISLSLHYHKRHYKQALTRGDGETGEDITRNVKMMQGVVKVLPPELRPGVPTPDDVWVRAEVVVTHEDFAKYFKGESNPRNTASGTAKRQSNPDKCRHLTVICYQLLPDGDPMEVKADELWFLKKFGFKVATWAVANTVTDVTALYQEYIDSKRAGIGYDIDGLVLEINDAPERMALGDKNGRPKGSVAYKFPHEKKPPKLIQVDWQVGNSGRITPVAIFEPVIIGGRKIERASLATVRLTENLKLFVGCEILVSLRNDVIPRVEANLSEGIVNT